MASATDLIDDILNDTNPVTVNAQPVGTTLAFTIRKFLLQVILERCAAVVPTREPMPVLKCVQFTLSAEGLRAVASDTDLSIISRTPLVTVAHPGVAVFPARKMLEIVKEAPDGNVDIRVRNTVASITIGRATWDLILEPGYDFPAISEIAEGTYSTIPRTDLLAALKAVRYAASKDTNRSSLMMIELRGGKLTACDGGRLQQVRLGDLPFAFPIPISAVDILVKLLGQSALDDVAIGETAHHLIFKLGDDVFRVSKLMAAVPDIEAMLLQPALANTHELVVDRDDLLAVIRRVRINADATTSAVGLKLTSGTLTVAAKDADGNTAQQSIDAAWAGPPRTLVVNHAFLTDLVKANAVTTCVFRLGDDTKTKKTPILLTDDTTGSVGVVQQMNADWVGVA